MKLYRLLLIGLFALLVLLSAACKFSVSTANIRDAYIAHDVNGQMEKNSTFSQNEVFFCIVDLANSPFDTSISAAWYAVDAEGVEPNTFIDEAEVITESGELTFDLANDTLWPVGTYKVDLSLNGELDQSLEFEVK